MAFEKEVKITCDYQDLEDIILKEYGHPYEIMPMEEVGSSQYAAVYEQSVTKQVIDEFMQEEIESMYKGKPKNYILGTLLAHLASLGKIEEGSYIIDVSW